MTSYKRIMELARLGADRRLWYRDARREIRCVCERNGWDRDYFTGILAVTSPRVAVRRNIRLTYSYMLGEDWTTGTIRSVRVAVHKWESNRRIDGPKTSAFYRCLRGCDQTVVVDTWMAIAFGVSPRKVKTKRVRQPIERRIRRIATLLRWTPAQTQAAIWTGIMRESGRNDQAFCIEDIDREFLPI